MNKEELAELKKGLKEIGFTEEEIFKALDVQESSSSDEKQNLLSEIDELEKAISKKKEMLKTMDGSPSESIEDNEEENKEKEEPKEDEEGEDEDDVKKSITNQLNSIITRLEEKDSEKDHNFEQIIKGLEDRITSMSAKLEKVSRSFVDRRPYASSNFIEKGLITEEGETIVSLSSQKSDILKGLDDLMEKSTGNDKEFFGQQIVKFNASGICDARALLRLSNEKKWKLVE